MVLQTHLRFIKHSDELEIVIGPLRESHIIIIVGNPVPTQIKKK